MPQSDIKPSKPLQLGRDALRIVLLGPAGAGKSALLGSSLTLQALTQQFYEERLLDTRGAIGSLPWTVLHADALILTADVSAGSAGLEADLTLISRFLNLLEQGRGRHTQIGGLPVFLVLTKCDLLAKPDDTSATWTDRIEQIRRRVEKRLEGFLARKRRKEPMAFGQVALHVRATAIRRPDLANGDTLLASNAPSPLTPTPLPCAGERGRGEGASKVSPFTPAEPYGVAELFRQCLESAWVFHERHIGSVWRLFLTVAGSIALVALMGVLAWVFFLIRLNRQQEIGSSAEILRNKVDVYLTHVAEQSPLARYRYARSRIEEIKSLQKDPGFAGLPRQEKDALAGRRQELEDYLNYEMQVALLTDPDTITDESLLKDAQTKLGEAAKVSENHIDWMDAEAGRRMPKSRMTRIA